MHHGQVNNNITNQKSSVNYKIYLAKQTQKL